MSQNLCRKYVLLVALFIKATSSFSQTLDYTFGDSGISMIGNTGPLHSGGKAIIQQTDGKLLVCGAGGGGSTVFGIVRFNINGSVDSSFGFNGSVSKSFNNARSGRATNILLQNDNKIVVTGFTDVDNTDFAIARFMPDGTPDLSFNNTGEALYNIGGHDNCLNSTLQPDGKIILCGSKSSGGWCALVRVNTDGSLDTTFNRVGIVTVAYGQYSKKFEKVLVKSNGSILACGNITDDGSKTLLVQFKSNGELDSTFGTNGVVIANVAGVGGFGHDMELQQDGKIVVCGRSVFYGGLLSRFLPDGRFDSSFGINGQVLITHPSGTVGTEQVEIDANGKIYVAGHIYVGDGNYEDMFLIRYNNDGTIDTRYSEQGIITRLSYYGERTHGLLIQQDGRIVTTGFVSKEFTSSEFVALRFWPYALSVETTGNKKYKLNAYPNPAEDFIHIELPQNINTKGMYRITNMLGQLVKQGSLQVDKKETIDLIDLPQGQYTITVQIENTQTFHTHFFNVKNN